MSLLGVRVLPYLAATGVLVACRSPDQKSIEAAVAPGQTRVLAPPPSHSDAVNWAEAPRQQLILRNQNLVLRLPDGANWKAQTRRGEWSGVEHDRAGSELWVRHAPARRTVSLDECEEQARFSLALLREPLVVAHERPTARPEGYGGRMTVALLPGGGVQVVQISVGVSRCLAVVFRTEGRPGFGELMRIVIDETLAELRIVDIGERGIHKGWPDERPGTLQPRSSTRL